MYRARNALARRYLATASMPATLSPSPLQYLKVNGKFFPLPPHMIKPGNTSRILCAGTETLEYLFRGNDTRDKEANAAILQYRRLRSNLLSSGYFAKWLVVTASGMLVLTETEQSARSMMALGYPGCEYHLDCLGCEITSTKSKATKAKTGISGAKSVPLPLPPTLPLPLPRAPFCTTVPGVCVNNVQGVDKYDGKNEDYGTYYGPTMS
ncbi:hypothetical protein B484DRAFT_395745 [Ochromonadaceae sp. CCMP2298]|nr:hypothetical protein B484DRAFT_395745 [Ochromonadaceae sp. CCMP2298]